jgi:hypothetical protein
MTHPIHRVEHFAIVAPYTVSVRFEDGTEQRIDFTPVLEGELFGPLRDVKIFNAVSLDTEVGTLTWPNGADFDPATLYDWPRLGDRFVEMARRWAAQVASRDATR